ncbi:adenylate/guanylate cyclase domain-containing protein [Almyronema epifaneia]|uniref:Adenylate/guanylate cyclase domain-containing protein n=1 Tax=Almyronema epifaneia S1 TaxID=2991925 RepID=A0ABW6IF46_9CYAN
MWTFAAIISGQATTAASPLFASAENCPQPTPLAVSQTGMSQPDWERNTASLFQQLLQQRNQYPEAAPAIDQQIQSLFGQHLAVMVLDAVGFSRSAQQSGIIAALAEIQRLQAIAVPAIEGSGGSVFKLDADNVYAYFPNAEAAVAAAQALISQLNVEGMHASIGIGYGEVLVIANTDIFGEELNLASKLGEDLAGRDEILLTEAAFCSLPPHTLNTDLLMMEISGLRLRTYRLQPPLP